MSQSYFFFFLGAFFFISLFNLDLDLIALFGAFFLTPGIDTSSLSAAAGEAPYLLDSVCYLMMQPLYKRVMRNAID